MPLLPTAYNRCRSDAKFLEYAAAGVAGIYADLEPYRGSIVHGETGLLYRTSADLGRCLDRLYEESVLRQRIRRQAHAHVQEYRRWSDNIGVRLSWYRRLLPDSGQATSLPAMTPSAVREGDYWQLQPEEPERQLLQVRNKADVAEATSQLAAVLERHPQYLAALQRQAAVAQ